MSKQQFELMRAEELSLLYDHSFTKKQAVSTGKTLVDEIFEAGDFDPIQVWANICRLKEVCNSADAEFRNRIEIFEKTNANGVEFSAVNGGNTVNYSEDAIYNALKFDLDARVELLKLAQKQPIIDAYGNDVPKVGTTPRKSSIAVKF